LDCKVDPIGAASLFPSGENEISIKKEI